MTKGAMFYCGEGEAVMNSGNRALYNAMENRTKFPVWYEVDKKKNKKGGNTDTALLINLGYFIATDCMIYLGSEGKRHFMFYLQKVE
jgi:hypothetical protein